MTTYRVTLQHQPNQPPTTGTWTEEAPAQRKYREWVGLYGTGNAVIQLLAEDDDGQRRVLKSWPPEG